MKLAERYAMPFLVEAENIKMRDKRITDEYIRARMKAIILGKDYKKKVDPEFNKAIENPAPVKPLVIKDKPIKTPVNNLTEIQQTIHKFIIEHMNTGMELREVEKILEKSKTQGGYTTSDIISVTNLIFENKITTAKNMKIAERNPMGSDEQAFMEFLKKNPEHNLSTTEVYRKIGLSSRKGTNVKKGLEERGLIKIKEIKYDKGWKKIIRLSN